MAAAAVTSNGGAAAAANGPSPGRLASVYSEVQTSRLLHALPLPSVLRSDFSVVDGPASSAAELAWEDQKSRVEFGEGTPPARRRRRAQGERRPPSATKRTGAR